MKKTRIITSTQRPEFDELIEYLSHPASERDGYDYDPEGNVYNIPSVFAKINGTYKESKKYKQDIVDRLTKFPNSCMLNEPMIRNHPITVNRENYNVNVYADKETYLAQDKNLVWHDPTVNNFLNGKIFGYKFSLSDNFEFRNLSNSKKVVLFNAMLVIANDPEIGCNSLRKLIEALINIPNYIVTLINNWDFKSSTPRIVYTYKYKMSEEEYWLLELLHKIGFDIIILSPTGTNVIEEYCDISTYSLGYYDREFDFDKYNYSSFEKIKKIFKKVGNKISHVENYSWLFIPIIAILINVAVYIGDTTGVTKTLFQCISIGVVFIGWVFDIGVTADTQENSNFATGATIIVVCCLLCIRGIIALSMWEPETNIKNGFLPIEESIQIGDTEVDTTFVTHVKADMVGDSNGNIRCYIENNSENTVPCYVRIYIGNTEVYKSYSFKPLQYLNNFKVSYDLPNGDTEITIKYFLYNGNRSQSYTNELLGQTTATIHIGDISELSKEYGYESATNNVKTDKPISVTE